MRLADYCEAMTDCGWSDDLKARWFSWFLAGAAKHIWQCTLSGEDTTKWSSIVASYRSHYRFYIELKTANLHYYALQYGDFT